MTVTRFGVWRAGLCCAGALASASLGAWLAARGAPGPAWGLVLLPAALMVSLRSTLQPFHLAWDGRSWRLADSGDASSPSGSGRPGRVGVSVDLGGWMLLRWRGQASGSAAWLPVQRAGLEAQWHALRCAVFAATSDVDPEAAAEP